MAKKFEVGDRVRINGARHTTIDAIDGMTGTIRAVVALGVYTVLADGPYPTAKSFLGGDYTVDDGWYVRAEYLTPLDARDDESTVDDTKRRFEVGDRVTIINANEEDRYVDYIVSETTKEDGIEKIEGTVRIVEQASGGDYFYAVVPIDERYRCPWDSDGLWLCDDDDVVRAESTPAATPRRSSSRSKKATTDAQPLDPKRINVVQVDISKAIVGDDFPARPSQAFKDAMCELLIGEYVRYGKNETDASS
jgi:hypothetical protein